MKTWCSRLLLYAILTGLCIPAGVAAETRIGLIWWPADPTNPANPFIRSLESCLTEQLAAACPGSRFIMPSTVRDALFPLMEPATQPETEEAFAALLSRSDIRLRLVKRMDYLVAFAGGTAAESQGGIVCGGGFGAGGCLGLAWINKDTRISVIIWDLGETTPARHQDSHVEGTTWIPAFILPIPIPAFTETEACHDMSRQIVEFVRSRPQGFDCR